MAKDIVMPKMGYDMTEGKLLRWIKHEGDTIDKGEAIAEIETDKVNIEVEAFDSGVLQRVLVQEGDTVPVGERIAIDRKSTRLNSSHANISYAVFCLKK